MSVAICELEILRDMDALAPTAELGNEATQKSTMDDTFQSTFDCVEKISVV
jgi:hypothetical protein